MNRWCSPALGVALAALCALAGCGLGAGKAPKDTQLTVTHEFGRQQLLDSRAPRVRGAETVMSLLRRNARVDTRYGGGFVEQIDGQAGSSAGGEPRDWFYYVNGVQASKGAAETSVHQGDHVWWDLHDWSQASNVPAVVGSFPEPFLAGMEGKRLPVRVECAAPSSPPCNTVLDRLRAFGVPAALSSTAGGEARYTLRVLVGPYAKLQIDPGVREIGRGPRSSGVYARFSSNTSRLELLDPAGETVQTLGSGAGLVAATRYHEEAPVWVVTGTDAAGVKLAAAAFDERSLRNRFALALSAPGTEIALPDQR
ncbi:MAG TPA: DUF4430 domain-containing protein [Polyangiaceae bacterium]|jgi:hypothetical protein|nr:DUF4430 domain-containing protein [Polyangiaceae bacterium]